MQCPGRGWGRVCTCWSHAPGRHGRSEKAKWLGLRCSQTQTLGLQKLVNKGTELGQGRRPAGAGAPQFPDRSETRGRGQELLPWPWGPPRQETRRRAWGSVPLRKSEALAIGSQDPRPLDPIPRTVSWSLPRTAQGPTLALAASLSGTPRAPVCRQGHQTRGLHPDGPRCSHGQVLSTKARR